MFIQIKMNAPIRQLFYSTIGLILITSNTFAQAQIDWIYKYSTPGSELGIKVIETNDGGYVSAGYEEISTGNRDWLIVKVDEDGNLLWKKNLGTSQYTNIAYDIKETADDGFVLSGSLSDIGTGSENFVLVKLNSDGATEWQQYYGLIGSFATSLTLTDDGGYVIAGNSNGLGSSAESDGLFRKLDSEGNLVWERRYGGSGRDEIFSIQQTSDLGFIATGHSQSADGDLEVNNGDYDIWVIKMNQEGELEWSNSFGGTREDVSRSVQQADDGGYLIAGYTFSEDGDIENNYGDQDIWLLKLDTDGNLEWENNYGGTDEDRAQAILNVSTGGYVISGWTRSDDVDVSINKGLIDIWIFRIDNDGNLEWESTYGGSRVDQSLDIKETSDGGFIATGNSYSNNGDFISTSGSGDLWVMKLSPISVGFKQEIFEETINVFPNPNSGQFSINIPNLTGKKNIRIIDMQGKTVFIKKDVDLNQVFSFDFPSNGFYVLEISVANKIYLEKLIID